MGLLKGKLRFESESLRESNRELHNPSQGWYEIYGFDLEKETDFDELKWSLREGQSLALLRIHMKAARKVPLSDRWMENLDRTIAFFRQAGKDVILRFAYDVEGKGRENEPASLKLIEGHVERLGELVRKHQDGVFVFQGLLIGSWGEMHSSRYGAREYVAALHQAVRRSVGEHVFLAFRCPVHVRYVIRESKKVAGESLAEKLERRRREEEFLAKAKIGIFNDGLFGDESHLGTFGEREKALAGWNEPWRAEDELSFMDRLGRFAPCGGEAVGDGAFLSFDFLRHTLEKMHLTYLNCAYDEKMLGSWKRRIVEEEGIWKWLSWYDYVGRRMGCRFVLRDVRCRMHVGRDSTFLLTVINRGFAPSYEPLEAGLAIGDASGMDPDGGNAVRVIRTVDYVESGALGEEQQVTIRIPAMPGDVWFFLRRKRDGRCLQLANEWIASEKDCFFQREIGEGIRIGKIISPI